MGLRGPSPNLMQNLFNHPNYQTDVANQRAYNKRMYGSESLDFVSDLPVEQILKEQQRVTPTLRAGRGGRTIQPRPGTGARESLRMAASAAEFMLVPSIITDGPAESALGRGLQTLEILPFVPSGLGKVGKHLVKSGMDPQNAAIVEEGMKIMSGHRHGQTMRGQQTRQGLRTMEVRAAHGNFQIPLDPTARRTQALVEGAQAAEDAKRGLQTFPNDPISTANRNAIKIADDARKRMGLSTPSPFSGPRSPLHGAGRNAAESREYKDMMTQSYYEGKVDFVEGFEVSPIQAGELRPKGSKRKPAKGKSAKKRYSERKNRKSNKKLLKSQGRLPQGYTPGSDYFLP